MKQNYFLKTLFFLSLFTALSSCGNDDGTEEYVRVSPVVVDVNANPFPYPTLSEYKFFEGDMKNLEPAYKVIPYDLNSTLFTDYAHKKRFIWMPPGTSATYSADGQVLEFPNGSVVIKNFYYDNVQPGNTRKILETRLMIRKNGGWVFAEYVWNESQTEAYLDMAGSNVDITWTENGSTKTANYRIPSEQECFTCHKASDGGESIATLIGPKPQNLNKNYNYADGSRNQLSKWIQEGYLSNNLPQSIMTTPDWTDTSKPLDVRVRSYLDINCAHCHSEGSHCDYRPIRLAFTETANPINLGVCVEPHQPVEGQSHIVASGNHLRSVMYYRMNTNDEALRMPLMGRSIVHTEGVALLQQWIASLETSCP